MNLKCLVAVFAFFAINLLVDQSQAVSLEKLDLYEDLALIDRLHQIQSRSEDLLHQCGLAKNSVQSLLTHKAIYRAEKLGTVEGRQFVKDGILYKIKTIREAIPQIIQCHGLKFTQLDEMMVLSPRQPLPLQNALRLICLKLPGSTSCVQEVGQMLSDLRPHCFQSLRTGLGNINEKHACFAGDRPMDAALTKVYKDDKQKQVFIYADLLYQKSLESAASSQIELGDILKVSNNSDNASELMSLLAAISTSGNSGLTGWMQSLEDRWLIEGLMGTEDPKVVFGEFRLLQQAKIRYQVARDKIEQKKIKLLLNGHDVSQWNRHNFMAAFLGCHYSNINPKTVINFIKALGLGYESKDFISHWLEGISMKDSLENFRADTDRYADSGKIGIEICR